MRLSASVGSSFPLVVLVGLVGLVGLGCARGSELAAGEGEPRPPAAAATASPDAAPPRSSEAGSPPSGSAATDPTPPFDQRWLDEVRAVVAAYEAWGRVDDEMRFAPWLCRIPLAATARWSESEHADTHGDKLYTLYAMDPVAYGAQRSAMGGTDPIPGLSQVIVKESFAPVPLADGQVESHGSGADGGVGEHRLRPAKKDGRRFVAGDRKGLYLMMKTDGATEGTDAGWVYATVLPDMITVTAVGVIDSCAGCHAEAGDGRLFGLPGPAEPPEPHDANAVPF